MPNEVNSYLLYTFPRLLIICYRGFS
jgi:hypothetical protein